MNFENVGSCLLMSKKLKLLYLKMAVVCINMNIGSIKIELLNVLMVLHMLEYIYLLLCLCIKWLIVWQSKARKSLFHS